MDRFPLVVEGYATRIHVCGRLTVELSGRRLEESLRGRQGRVLFSYLALNRERPVRRDELAEALWSGKGAPPAYESLLAPPLSRLRKALGPGVLEGRSELQLILPLDAWIDWEVAPRELRRARGAADPKEAWEAAKAALEIADGGLLPAWKRPGSTRAAASSRTCESRRSRRWRRPAHGSAAPPTPRPSRPPAPPSSPSRSANPPAPR
jgi:hypothetical protein